jgi:hypothetical protein
MSPKLFFDEAMASPGCGQIVRTKKVAANRVFPSAPDLGVVSTTNRRRHSAERLNGMFVMKIRITERQVRVRGLLRRAEARYAITIPPETNYGALSF